MSEDIPETFKTAILEFHDVQDQKNILKKTSAPLNRKQKELNEKIVAFMTEHEIERLDVGNESLVLRETERKEPLKPENMPDIVKIHPHFKDKSPNEVEEFVTFVFDNRPTIQGKSLKRIKPKTPK